MKLGQAITIAPLIHTTHVVGDVLSRRNALDSHHAQKCFKSPHCKTKADEFKLAFFKKIVGEDLKGDMDECNSNDDKRPRVTPKTENVGNDWYSNTATLLKRLPRLLLDPPVPIYLSLMESFPLLTNSVMASLIGGFGDMFAQLVEMTSLRTSPGVGEPMYDVRRTFAIAIESLCISGPLMHYAYNSLEAVLPVHTEDPDDDTYEWLAAAIHVIVDAVIIDAIYVGALLVTSTLMEGRGNELLRPSIWDTYAAAVRVSWVSSLFFAPIQCALVRYVRVDLRVLAMNLQDVSWNAVMSYMIHRSRR